MVLGLHCYYAWDFVFRASFGLAAGQFATEIGIIDLDTFRKHGGLLSFEHDLQEVMLDPSCVSITDTNETFEYQDKNIALILGLEEHRLEPCGQG